MAFGLWTLFEGHIKGQKPKTKDLTVTHNAYANQRFS